MATRIGSSWRQHIELTWLLLCLVAVEAEICCCPDLSVYLSCGNSNKSNLENNGFRCVAEQGTDVTLQCNVGDADHDAVQSISYSYYKAYVLSKSELTPANSDSVQLTDCASPTCVLSNVTWSATQDSSTVTNYDNFMYACLVNITLTDGSTVLLSSNTMWLDVFYNVEIPDDSTVSQVDYLDLNTGESYKSLECSLPDTNPPTKPKWSYKESESDSWAELDFTAHPRYALVDTIVDSGATTTPRGSLVVMIFNPTEDSGFYRCDAVYTTTSPVVGSNTTYQVSQYKLAGDGQTSTDTPVTQPLSSITSLDYVDVSSSVDFTLYARDTNAEDVGRFQWKVENDNTEWESLDTSKAPYTNMTISNYNRSLEFPASYDLYGKKFMCYVIRGNVTKKSEEFNQPVIVPKVMDIPLSTKTCTEYGDDITVSTNTRLMMDDGVDSYDQKLPGSGKMWWINGKSITFFNNGDGVTNDTVLRTTDSNFRTKLATSNPDQKCNYFSYTRTYTSEYQLIEVLKVTRQPDGTECSDVDTAWCASHVTATCSSNVLTVSVNASSVAQCLVVTVTNSSGTVLTSRFQTVADSCAGRSLSTNFTDVRMDSTYTITLAPEGASGCTLTDVLCNDSSIAHCSKPTIGNGTVLPDEGNISAGDAYTVTCDTGYKLVGQSIMSCQGDGTFLQTPVCKLAAVQGCSRPTIKDGTVSPADVEIEVGEVYTVECSTGYTVDGNTSATGFMECRSDGSLNQTLACTATNTDEVTSPKSQGVIIAVVVVAVLVVVGAAGVAVYLKKTRGAVCPGNTQPEQTGKGGPATTQQPVPQHQSTPGNQAPAPGVQPKEQPPQPLPEPPLLHETTVPVELKYSDRNLPPLVQLRPIPKDNSLVFQPREKLPAIGTNS